MKAIAILPEGDDAHPTTFRAVTTDSRAAGRTPGEALDALTSQLGVEKAGAAVVVQLFRPDSHFTAEQSERLSALMSRWRTARDAGSALPPAEQAELEKLVEEELHGSAERAAQMSREVETTGDLRRHQLDEKRIGLSALLQKETRRIRWLFMLWLVMLLSLAICVFLIGAGVIGNALTVIGVATLMNAVTTLLAGYGLGSTRRMLKEQQASLKDPADGGKQRKQARAR